MLLAWIVFLVAISFNAYDAFLRVTPSVTSEQLRTDLGVDPNALGTMFTFYFVPYVLLQIPVGMLVDRVGAKRLLIGAVLLSAAGSVVYGAASFVAVAFAGRLLMGIGGAVPGVAPIYLASRWFPRSQIGLLAGLAGTSTVVGSIGGEALLARALDSWTWREAAFAAAGLGGAIAVLILLLVRDHPPGASAQPGATSNGGAGVALASVLRNRLNWLNSLWGGLTLMPMLAFTSLWATPFFSEHFGVSTAQAATASSVGFLGLAFGGPAAGILSERLRSRRRPMMLFTSVAILDLLVLVYAPGLPFTAAFPLMFVLGFCLGSQGSLVFAVALEINDDREAGLAIGFTQGLSNLGGALFPPLIGLLLTRAPSTLGTRISVDHYPLALSVLPIGLAVAVLLAYLLPETYRPDESPGAAPIAEATEATSSPQGG